MKIGALEYLLEVHLVIRCGLMTPKKKRKCAGAQRN